MSYLERKNFSKEETLNLVKESLENLVINPDVPLGLNVGFSQEYLDAMYAIGVKFYENNRLEDAIKIFYQLIPLEPIAIRNYKGLGACFQAKEDYETAMHIYTNSIPLAAMDADIYFYIGQCLFLTKDFAEAEKTLAMANYICNKYPEQWASIATQIKELHQRAKERVQH